MKQNCKLERNHSKEIVLEYITCDFCGGNDFQLIYSLRDSLTEFDGVLNLVKCEKCALVFINPRPTEADISNFYPAHFISYQFKKNTMSEPRLKNWLTSFVVDKISNQRIKFLRKFVNFRANLKLSDFGCGEGYFLQSLSSVSNLQLSGFDFNEKSVENCVQAGLNVELGAVNSLRKVAEYNVITMWHFLEHTFSPVGAICRANQMLLENGILIIEVPNWESLENKLFREKSFLLDPPRHLYQFTEASLSRLLEAGGFEVIHSDCSPGEGGWIGSVQNLLFKGKLYRNFREYIFLTIALSVFLMPIDILSSLSHSGSILRIVAKKK